MKNQDNQQQETKKVCKACNLVLDVTDFKTKGNSKAKGGGKYLEGICRECSNVRYNSWVAERREQLKTAVYKGYGNKCNCCGETEHDFLTIDHVNNDGNIDREEWRNGASYTMYRQIIRQNFPDRFQLLCYNCNCGKYRNHGICPHNK